MNRKESTPQEEEHIDPAFIISYKEAEILLGLPAIEEKYIMINESLGKINNGLKQFENFSSELVQISIKSYEIPDFIKNAENTSLEIVKNDLKLYISTFDELIKKANNISTISSIFIKNMSNELNDMIKEMNRIKITFEEMTKNLSIPLILEQLIKDTEEKQVQKDEGKKLDELKNEINNFKGNVTNLYELLNKPFEFFIWCFSNIPNIIGEYTKDSNIITSNIFK